MRCSKQSLHILEYQAGERQATVLQRSHRFSLPLRQYSTAQSVSAKRNSAALTSYPIITSNLADGLGLIGRRLSQPRSILDEKTEGGRIVAAWPRAKRSDVHVTQCAIMKCRPTTRDIAVLLVFPAEDYSMLTCYMDFYAAKTARYKVTPYKPTSEW